VRGGGERAGDPGRGDPGGRDDLRPRRTDRQPRHRGAGAQPRIARSPDRALVPQHAGDRADRRAQLGDRRSPAPPVCGRPGVHRVLGVASGCDPQGPRTARRDRRILPAGLEGSVSAPRPGRPRPPVREADPDQQPVRQGRRGLRARKGVRDLPAQEHASGDRQGGPEVHRRDRRRNRFAGAARHFQQRLRQHRGPVPDGELSARLGRRTLRRDVHLVYRQ